MDKESFIDAIQSIGLCEDAVERRTLLTNLQDEVTKVYDEMETDKTTINTLNETINSKDGEISALQKANMDYFTRLSSQKSETQKLQDSTGIKPEEVKTKKFEDLFNEKGELKL
jgi:predicted nuclease with TOPRIM domain